MTHSLHVDSNGEYEPVVTDEDRVRHINRILGGEFRKPIVRLRFTVECEYDTRTDDYPDGCVTPLDWAAYDLAEDPVWVAENTTRVLSAVIVNQ